MNLRFKGQSAKKFRNVSLTPRFSEVWRSAAGNSTVSTVSEYQMHLSSDNIANFPLDRAQSATRFRKSTS
jgi:hypothetical protein